MRAAELEMPIDEEHLRFVRLVRKLLQEHPEKYNRTDYAKYLGVTRDAITKMLGSGKVKLGEDPNIRRKWKSDWIKKTKEYFKTDWPIDNNFEENGKSNGAVRVDRNDSRQQYMPNAAMGGGIPGTDKKMPVYGTATCGKHGEFPFNGEPAEYITMPPMLEGVPEAYAVYVMGNSMEDLFRVGEIVYVHPKMQFHKGDPVVAQIRAEGADDGTTPLAFLKNFISWDDKKLVLEQKNPRETLRFPNDRVVRVHRVVGKILRGL